MPKTKYHHGDLKNALIAAGIDILSSEGLAGMSLRKVAQRVGVSHTAPYAHYADKQALVAAIATEGYRRLFESLRAVLAAYPGDPLRQLVEGAWCYSTFALHDPAHFQITFAGAVEQERDHPALVEMTRQTFALVVGVVRACQAVGALRAGPPELLTVSVWSVVHGFAALTLQNQLSHTIWDRLAPREMLLFSLGQLTQVALTPAAFPAPGRQFLDSRRPELGD